MDLSAHASGWQGQGLPLSTSNSRPQLPTITQDPRVAAAALASEHLAALPTETVYGLGGLASSPTAVAAIFRAKGRPAGHPVIVHVGGQDDIDHWAREVPATARALARAFWPGPLTLVVPRAAAVSDAITGGQDTVALRAPAHPLFQQVIAELTDTQGSGVGIAAPSANRFGQVSPTTAAAVRRGLGAQLSTSDVILDGGPCIVGVESTIVVCSSHTVTIARAGGVTAEQLAGIVELAEQPANASPRVPGSLASHYAPAARVILADDPATVIIADASAVGLIANAAWPTPSGWLRLCAPTGADEYARDLYAALHRADEAKLDVVVAVPPEATGIGAAIGDRLTRAATR
ncbi:MAG: L-threonylcarbamoyladenylate synthase [Candidatus Nanopelagicales bacterium]